MEKTSTLATEIKPKLSKGREIRTTNQKMQDNHLKKFDVAMKLNFDSALAQGEQERTLIKTI